MFKRSLLLTISFARVSQLLIPTLLLLQLMLVLLGQIEVLRLKRSHVRPQLAVRGEQVVTETLRNILFVAGHEPSRLGIFDCPEDFVVELYVFEPGARALSDHDLLLGAAVQRFLEYLNRDEVAQLLFLASPELALEALEHAARCLLRRAVGADDLDLVDVVCDGELPDKVEEPFAGYHITDLHCRIFERQ